MAGLLQLLQQLGGSLGGSVGQIGKGLGDTIGKTAADVADTNEPIVVTGGQTQERAFPPPVFDVPERPQVDPRYVLNESRVPPHEKDIEEILPRKGMFGVKGTLRDVLGTLGDAFIVQSGGDPVYRPQRQREREGDALLGFTENPLQAIERLATHNPEAAQELYDAHQANELRKAQQASLDANRKSLIDSRNQDVALELSQRAAYMLGAAKTPEQVLRVMQMVDGLAQRNGLSLEDLGLSLSMSPEDLSVYADGGMNRYQQHQIPMQRERVDIAQQNADTARISATRPRAGSNPTAASMAAPLIDKLQRGGTLTPVERETLDRLGYDVPKPAGRRSVRGAATTTSTRDTSGWTVRRNN